MNNYSNINKYNESEIMTDPLKLSHMNNIIREQQFSESFLINTNTYYDSWTCLKYQENLSPYFCFRYLYDNENDSADNWTDYNDVIRYLNKHGITNKEFIEHEFNRAMRDRNESNK